MEERERGLSLLNTRLPNCSKVFRKLSSVVRKESPMQNHENEIIRVQVSYGESRKLKSERTHKRALIFSIRVLAAANELLHLLIPCLYNKSENVGCAAITRL